MLQNVDGEKYASMPTRLTLNSCPQCCPANLPISLLLPFLDDVSDFFKSPTALPYPHTQQRPFCFLREPEPPSTTSTLLLHLTTHSAFSPVTGWASHVPIYWASFFPMYILMFLFLHSRSWSPVGSGSQERNVTGRKAEIGQLSFFLFLFFPSLQGSKRK